MRELHGQIIIASVGLITSGLVAYSGHDGWGWILFVTFLITTW
jgi:hypothetical protein